MHYALVLRKVFLQCRAVIAVWSIYLFIYLSTLAFKVTNASQISHFYGYAYYIHQHTHLCWRQVPIPPTLPRSCNRGWRWSVFFFCCTFSLCPFPSVFFHLPLAYHTCVSVKSPHPSSPPLTHSCDTTHIIMTVCQTLAASFSVWTNDSCLLFFEQIYSHLNWEFFYRRCVNVCIFSCLSSLGLITNMWLPTFSTCSLVSSNNQTVQGVRVPV